MKKMKHLCSSRCCQNRARVIKKGDKKYITSFCYKHWRQRAKETNILGYTFDALKQAAKRRGKQFDLTLEQFKEFCERTKYLELKGKTSSSLSIDRIDPTKGYSADNIQAVELGYNVRKFHFEDKYYQRHGRLPY